MAWDWLPVVEARARRPPANILHAALAYAEKGIPVFPCKQGGKKPLIPKCPNAKGLTGKQLASHARDCSRDGHGFHDATTDQSKITAWFNRYPDANIGIPTGERSGIISLDVDTYKPGAYTPEDVERELGELPDTKVISTGRGGLQYLFAYPEALPGSPENTLGPGVCVKATGGYVIAPPSVTTRPYTVLTDLPLADAPEWLLKALRRPHSAPDGAAKAATSTKFAKMDGKTPIHEGQRNDTLFRYGCSLRSKGDEYAAILEELRNTNEKLCRPALDAQEVERIAASAAKYSPGNASPGPSAEALEALQGIEDVNLWGRTWKGQEWKSPRSVMVVLIEEARRHGKKTKTGVRVSLSVRNLALLAGVAQKTAIAALKKLKAAKLIRPIPGSGTKSGAYVLVTPSVAGCNHSTTQATSLSGYTQRRPQKAPRLRYSKPVYETDGGVSFRVGTVLRLGKRGEHIIDILTATVGEWTPFAELGAALDIENHRDLRHRALPRLEEAGVVECSDHGVRLRQDWQDTLYRKREQDQEIDDFERHKKKFAEESRVYALKLEAEKLASAGLDLEEIAAELRVGTEDVRRVLNLYRPTQPDEASPEHDGYVEELERVEDTNSAREEHQVADFVEVEDFDGIEVKPLLSPLAVAALECYERNPQLRKETPRYAASWIANTLWAYELVEGKPTRYEVGDALEELVGETLQAA